MSLLFFFVFAGIAVLGAVGVLVCRSPLHGALSLIGTMVSMAVIYLLHHAEFIFVVQLMVYAGAVMMLIVFVIMLLDLQKEATQPTRITGPKLFGIGLAGALAVLLLIPAGAEIAGVRGGMTEEVLMEQGSVAYLAEQLFDAYLLPFEIASILLLVGLVGSVALAKKSL